MINQLTLKHQDGTSILALTDGGYAIENDGLAISIRTESEDAQYAHFCIHNIPIDRYPVEGDVFQTDISEFEEIRPGVVVNHAYFGFHAEEVASKWTVLEAGEDTLHVSLEATHDDINYGGDQAKPCTSVGVFTLRRRPLADLWIPS